MMYMDLALSWYQWFMLYFALYTRFALTWPQIYGKDKYGNDGLLAGLKKHLEINIIKDSGMEIEFDLIGVDAPIANALRRILISEVCALGHVAAAAPLPMPWLSWGACIGRVACAVVDGVLSPGRLAARPSAALLRYLPPGPLCCAGDGVLLEQHVYHPR